MSFFNDAQINALLTGRYICSQCGAIMKFEDKNEDILICPSCGHSVDLEHYGFENGEEYEAMYPTKEKVLGYNADEYRGREIYDEVCGELSDD